MSNRSQPVYAIPYDVTATAIEQLRQRLNSMRTRSGSNTVCFFDPRSGFSFERHRSEIDPYDNSIKLHFLYRGYAIFQGRKITSHSVLADILDNNTTA